MKDILLVAIGGGVGAVVRYKLGGWVLQHTLNWRFPLGTFVVNVIGCLVAGVLGGVIEKYGLFTLEMRLFLFTGILGGFTTFSAFGVETMFLLRHGEVWAAGSNVVLTILCSLAVLWLGWRLVFLWGR